MVLTVLNVLALTSWYGDEDPEEDAVAAEVILVLFRLRGTSSDGELAACANSDGLLAALLMAPIALLLADAAWSGAFASLAIVPEGALAVAAVGPVAGTLAVRAGPPLDRSGADASASDGLFAVLGELAGVPVFGAPACSCKCDPVR